LAAEKGVVGVLVQIQASFFLFVACLFLSLSLSCFPRIFAVPPGAWTERCGGLSASDHGNQAHKKHTGNGNGKSNCTLATKASSEAWDLLFAGTFRES
jgi:hypothetical protein